MTIFVRLFVIFTFGILSALSAELSVNPQDSAFLESFDDQQKRAIYNFLLESSGGLVDTGNNG